jgi:hypothetical protein
MLIKEIGVKWFIWALNFFKSINLINLISILIKDFWILILKTQFYKAQV